MSALTSIRYLRPMAHDRETQQAIDDVAYALRQRIIGAELRSGARLSQQAIADEFGISRHHVREVFRMLHSERLITMEPNVSIKVAPVSVVDWEEIHEIRLLLEPPLARLSVPNLTRSHVAALREVLETMAGAETMTTWLEAHERFHTILYRQAARPWMVEIVDHGRQLARRYLSILHSDLGWRKRIAPHAEMLAAVEAGNGLLVEELVATHMKEAHDPLFRHLSKIAIDPPDKGATHRNRDLDALRGAQTT
jgi:DNA-binding GntR family transcriptional regulator